jgi:hypothetical protein
MQIISSGASNVSAGTFTIAFDNFTVSIPGTVSAYSNLYVFNTSGDLSSYLEPGDQVCVDCSVYTVAALKFKYSWQLFVNEKIKAAVLNTDVAEAAILARPIPHNVSQQKPMVVLENQPAFGQVHVERTLVLEGYSWTVTFVSNVSNQPALVVNTLQLLGLNPAIAVQTVSVGLAPANYFLTVVEASSSVVSATIDSLRTGEAWYFRVLATNAIGDGVMSSMVSVILAAAPRCICADY